MRLSATSTEETEGVWFWVAEGAKTFPHPHRFGSSVWWNPHQQPEGPGEIYEPVKRPYSGINPNPHVLKGKKYCGPKEAFIGGSSVSDPVIDDTCCAPVGWSRGYLIFFEALFTFFPAATARLCLDDNDVETFVSSAFHVILGGPTYFYVLVMDKAAPYVEIVYGSALAGFWEIGDVYQRFSYVNTDPLNPLGTTGFGFPEFGAAVAFAQANTPALAGPVRFVMTASVTVG